MKFIDFDLPFFLPVWRRVALVTVTIGWGLFEFSTGANFWAALFVGAGLYAGWQLFFAGLTFGAGDGEGDD